jgi:hypothetical protein
MQKPDAIQTLLDATKTASSRLMGMDCDVVTVAEQLRQTSELVLAELKAAAASDPAVGRWETHVDDDGVMIRVRWSVQGERGYLWVRHYPNTAWGRSAAEGEAEMFNSEHRDPSEFPCGICTRCGERSRWGHVCASPAEVVS